ncbi:hypothetical protein HYC85_012760 [Camellia sinensis]|uniref:Uncharacterized protein n=1 Tax=Camellia sinensis TaxID=4442 RepID=A0A7J7HE12_CAMSI|nr:hypothetical protein HYC85_012760 [Camellia sinensis]
MKKFVPDGNPSGREWKYRVAGGDYDGRHVRLLQSSGRSAWEKDLGPRKDSTGVFMGESSN